MEGLLQWTLSGDGYEILLDTGTEPMEGLCILIELAVGGSSGRMQTAVTDSDGRSRTVELGAWQTTAS